jgi:hypothetical protein
VLLEEPTLLLRVVVPHCNRAFWPRGLRFFCLSFLSPFGPEVRVFAPFGPDFFVFFLVFFRFNSRRCLFASLYCIEIAPFGLEVLFVANLYVSLYHYLYIYIYMSSYYHICVLILLYMCPHAAQYVLILLYMCPHATICVSSYYYVCVLMLLYMCPHTSLCVSSYYYICDVCGHLLTYADVC